MVSLWPDISFYFFSVSNNETLTTTEGNPFRDVWKAACWKMSQEVFEHLNELYHIQWTLGVPFVWQSRKESRLIWSYLKPTNLYIDKQLSTNLGCPFGGVQLSVWWCSKTFFSSSPSLNFIKSVLLKLSPPESVASSMRLTLSKR